MQYIFKIIVEVIGNASKDEVRNYIGFELGANGLSQDNAVIAEDNGVDISIISIEED